VEAVVVMENFQVVVPVKLVDLVVVVDMLAVLRAQMEQERGSQEQ
jgi:hypothetical protein